MGCPSGCGLEAISVASSFTGMRGIPGAGGDGGGEAAD